MWVMSGTRPLETYRSAEKRMRSRGRSRGIGGRHRVARVALRPALQQVEVAPVGGELHVHRHAHLLAQQLEDRAHPGHEGGVRGQTLEGDHHVGSRAGPSRSRSGGGGRRCRGPTPTCSSAGYSGPHSRRRSAISSVSNRRVLQVDDVDLARGVAHDLVGGDVDPQPGLAGRDEHRVVVAHAVHGAGAEAGHEAHQAVLAPDARRPAELVVAERHAGERRAGSRGRRGCRRPPGS